MEKYVFSGVLKGMIQMENKRRNADWCESFKECITQRINDFSTDKLKNCLRYEN